MIDSLHLQIPWDPWRSQSSSFFLLLSSFLFFFAARVGSLSSGQGSSPSKSSRKRSKENRKKAKPRNDKCIIYLEPALMAEWPKPATRLPWSTLNLKQQKVAVMVHFRPKHTQNSLSLSLLSATNFWAATHSHIDLLRMGGWVILTVLQLEPFAMNYSGWQIGVS